MPENINKDEMDGIKTRMAMLEKLIRETKSRLPAHSAKPPVMMELFEYEDEYDELQKKLMDLQKKII